MRRKDRAVTEIKEILSIIAACKVCRIALSDGAVPYIIPMNFGYTYIKGQLQLYFHCAKEGRKLEIIGSGAAAAFEMDCRHRLLGDACDPCVYSFAYASVLGSGRIAPVTDRAEKEAGLAALMQQQTGKRFSFADKDLREVTVLRLEVAQFTAKQKSAPAPR